MSTVNPYVFAHRITRKRQGFSWFLPLFLLSSGVAAYLADPVLLHFLQSDIRSAGIEQMGLRLGILMGCPMPFFDVAEFVYDGGNGHLSSYRQMSKLLSAFVNYFWSGPRFKIDLAALSKNGTFISTIHRKALATKVGVARDPLTLFT